MRGWLRWLSFSCTVRLPALDPVGGWLPGLLAVFVAPFVRALSAGPFAGWLLPPAVYQFVFFMAFFFVAAVLLL